jgi:hypothetical protein
VCGEFWGGGQARAVEGGRSRSRCTAHSVMPWDACISDGNTFWDTGRVLLCPSCLTFLRPLTRRQRHQRMRELTHIRQTPDVEHIQRAIPKQPL